MAQGQRRNEGISQIVQDLQQQSWLAVEAQLQLLANRLIIMKAAHDQLKISKTTQQMTQICHNLLVYTNFQSI